MLSIKTSRPEGIVYVRLGQKRTLPGPIAMSPFCLRKRTLTDGIAMSVYDPKRTVNRRRGMYAYPLKRSEKQRCESAEQQYSPF
jgi:hypothetical protein